MKKQKYYLAAGVLACSAISGLAMPLANTFALDPGSYTQEVTVGEVDETIYSVDINWGDMTFDWKYDAEANEFNFQPHKKCMPIANNDSTASVLTALQEQGRLYNDLTSCETLATNPLDAEMYAYLTPDGGIGVYDSSTNGKLKTKLSFTASEKYDWVTGKFGTWSTFGDLFLGDPDEYLSSSNNTSYSSLVLEKNSNYNASAESVVANETIGTVTITIEPDLN